MFNNKRTYLLICNSTIYVLLCHIKPNVRVQINPLTTDDAIWRCLTLVARYQLAQSVLMIGFALAKNGGMGGGGWTYSRHAVYIVAALAVCRTALVGTGWTISHLLSTNGLRNHSSPLVGHISRSVGSV